VKGWGLIVVIIKDMGGVDMLAAVIFLGDMANNMSCAPKKVLYFWAVSWADRDGWTTTTACPPPVASDDDDDDDEKTKIIYHNIHCRPLPCAVFPLRCACYPASTGSSHSLSHRRVGLKGGRES